jgi:hypothetical protein
VVVIWLRFGDMSANISEGVYTLIKQRSLLLEANIKWKTNTIHYRAITIAERGKRKRVWKRGQLYSGLCLFPVYFYRRYNDGK